MDVQVPYPKFQAFDSNGDPLSGGKVHTYEPGGTTALTTYKERSLTTAHTNPIVLDSRGEIADAAGIYCANPIKIVLKDSDDTTVWTMDDMRPLDGSSLEDDDGDTKYQLEESADEDIHRWDCAGTEQMILQDGALLPTTDNDIDIGSSSKKIKAVHAHNLFTISDLAGFIIRPTFSWKDADEIYLNPGSYYHSGTTNQLVYWASQLTFKLGAGGSNASNSALAGNDIYYIYLDDSAIVTAGTTLLTNSEILAVTGEPTWSASKRGWYSGSDRCIFAVLVNGGDVKRFWHDGGRYCSYDTYWSVRASADLDSAYTDIDFSSYVPVFSTKANANFFLEVKTADATVAIRCRPNGSASASGVKPVGLERIAVDQGIYASMDVFLDSAQIFEASTTRDGDDFVGADVNGWYLPQGL